MSVSLIDGHIDDDVQMTDDEIIKALECCDEFQCDECPLDPYSTDPVICERRCKQESLNLINRQKAEIERLEYNIESLEYELEDVKYGDG